MNDIELAALTELVATERFHMEAENKQREICGQSLAYFGSIEWDTADKLQEELKQRGII